MEHKQTEATITAVDEAQGIVEAVWAVMGNVDDGSDIIHPGAFTKTFNERGHQIKLLDNHRTDSVMASLGLVKELREVRRGELPQEVMEKYPDATGGAWGKFQFLLDTPEGKGVFTRIQKKAILGWSFGYDAVDKDHSMIIKDGQQIPIRNLRQIKLWEISPVLFAMNEATRTTDAKNADAKPTEAKPYGVVEEDGKYCVYKLDADGNPTGERLGEHDTRAEAMAQMRAMYASEGGKAGYYDEDEDKAADFQTVLNYERVEQGLWEERWKIDSALNQVINKTLHDEEMDDAAKRELITVSLSQFNQAVLQWLERALTAGMIMEEMYKSLKAGRVLSARNAKRIKAAMDELHTCLMEAGLMEMPEDEANTGPQKAAIPSTSDATGSQPEPDGAGTDTDSSTRLLKLIELELEETEV